MPNLQALGITSNMGQGGGQGSQNMNNPLGMSTLNLGALPMNPALVAAALNQAGWGLIGNLQGNQGSQDGPQGFGNPSGFSGNPNSQSGQAGQNVPQNQGAGGGSGFLSWMNQGGAAGDAAGAHGSNTQQAPSWPQREKGGSFLKYDV